MPRALSEPSLAALHRARTGRASGTHVSQLMVRAAAGAKAQENSIAVWYIPWRATTRRKTGICSVGSRLGLEAAVPSDPTAHQDGSLMTQLLLKQTDAAFCSRVWSAGRNVTAAILIFPACGNTRCSNHHCERELRWAACSWARSQRRQLGSELPWACSRPVRWAFAVSQILPGRHCDDNGSLRSDTR